MFLNNWNPKICLVEEHSNPSYENNYYIQISFLDVFTFSGLSVPIQTYFSTDFRLKRFLIIYLDFVVFSKHKLRFFFFKSQPRIYS